MIATWRVLVALVLVPCLHFLYTGIAYVYLNEQFAVMYFFFAPFVCSIAIKGTENGVRVWRSLAPLYLAVRNDFSGEGLLKQRNRLKERVRQVNFLISQFVSEVLFFFFFFLLSYSWTKWIDSQIVDEFGWLSRLGEKKALLRKGVTESVIDYE